MFAYMQDDKAIAARIKKVRAEADLTQEGFAARLGDVTRGAVGNWERGLGIKRENLVLIAEKLGVSLEWLATGDVKPADGRKVRLVGYVGAAQTIYHFDDNDADWVDAPPSGADGVEAVEVRGGSMWPLVEDGAVIYYSRMLSPDEMLNKRCVVKLEDERILVKTLKRGGAPGLYTLASFNAPDIDDVAVIWAAPIDWIKP